MVLVTVTRTLAWGLSIGVLRAHAISTAARGLPGSLPLALVLLWTLQTAGIATEGAVIVYDSTLDGRFFPEVRLPVRCFVAHGCSRSDLPCCWAKLAVEGVLCVAAGS